MRRWRAIERAVSDAMPIIDIHTSIAAPVDRVFDLARSIDLHTDSVSGTGERAIAGVTSGLIGADEEVTWRARHLGVWQTLTVRITRFEHPVSFTDTMVRGAFRGFKHEHLFAATCEGTAMRDVFDYQSPLGFLGRLADVLFLERYMRAFLVARNRVLKTVAESNDWKRYLPQM
jgi:ligand-binding SRPBCC domain-containing protein